MLEMEGGMEEKLEGGIYAETQPTPRAFFSSTLAVAGQVGEILAANSSYHNQSWPSDPGGSNGTNNVINQYYFYEVSVTTHLLFTYMMFIVNKDV